LSGAMGGVECWVETVDRGPSDDGHVGQWVVFSKRGCRSSVNYAMGVGVKNMRAGGEEYSSSYGEVRVGGGEGPGVS